MKYKYKNEDSLSSSIKYLTNVIKSNIEKTNVIKNNSFHSSVDAILNKKTGYKIPEKIGQWFMFENAKNNNLITDISNVCFIKGYINKYKDLISITPIFCDNLMLFVLVPESLCVVKGYKVKLQNGETGAINKKIRNRLKNAGIGTTAIHGVKVKNTLFLDEKTKSSSKYTSKTRTSVKQILKNQPKILQCFKEKYYKQLNIGERIVIVTYKVELADLKIENVINCLNKFLDSVFAENIFLLDFDFTADFAGTMDREELINYLTTNHSFKLQNMINNTSINCFQYFQDTKTILDNKEDVGNDCLTWLDEYKGKTIRCKLYNKFVCQITSGGTTIKIGNHIYDFLNCPDKRLGESFKHPQIKEKGFTRLEITYYSLGILPVIDDMQLIKKKIINYFFNQKLFYWVPLSTQWENLCNTIQNNCIIYNKTHQIFHIGYWVNLLTKKITGIQFKVRKTKPRKNLTKKEMETFKKNQIEKLKKSIISNYSFVGLPCYFIEIVEDSFDKNKLTFNCKTFIKIRGYTIITRTGYLGTYTDKNINIQECGLVNTKHIKIEIHRKSQHVVPMAHFKENIDYFEIKNDNKVMLYLTTKKNNILNVKQEKLSYNTNFYRLNKLNEQKEKIDYYNTQFKKYIQQKQLTETINTRRQNVISKLKKLPTSLEKHFFTMENQPFFVSIIHIKGADNQNRFLCYDDNNEIVFYANEFITNLITTNINILPKFVENGITYYDGCENKKNTHLISFTVKNSIYDTVKGKRYVQIENCFINPSLTFPKIKEKTTKNIITKQQLKYLKNDIPSFHKLEKSVGSNISWTKGLKLETLNENTEYTVIALESRVNRSLERWLIKLKEHPDKIYKSNLIFDAAIVENKSLLERQFNMKTDCIGKDKYNHPAMLLSLI